MQKSDSTVWHGTGTPSYVTSLYKSAIRVSVRDNLNGSCRRLRARCPAHIHAFIIYPRFSCTVSLASQIDPTNPCETTYTDAMHEHRYTRQAWLMGVTKLQSILRLSLDPDEDSPASLVPRPNVAREKIWVRDCR